MITSKEDYNHYIAEDYKRNIGFVSRFHYFIKMIYKSDDYMAYNYLKALRKYEYALNVQRKTIWGKVACAYRQFKWHHLSVKYNIVLPPNVIGCGFRMAHVVGGGYNYKLQICW